MVFFNNNRSNIPFVQPIAIDLSVLATGVNQAPVQNARVRKIAAAFTTPQVSAPELTQENTRPLRERVSEVRNLRSFIDPNNDLVRRAGSDPDLRNTFTVFRALDQLRVLSKFAAEKNTSQSERQRLNAQFEAGLAEVQSFIAQNGGDKLKLFFAETRARVEAAVKVPKTPVNFTGDTIATARNTALNGFQGNERFTITLGINNSVDAVDVDLSTLTGPITLDSVANLINQRIGSVKLTNPDGSLALDGQGNPRNKFTAKAEVFQDDKTKAFGLRFITTPGESLKLSDPAAQPSLVLANGVTPSSAGSTQARLARIDDLNATLRRTDIETITVIDRKADSLASQIFADSEAKREADAKAKKQTFNAKPTPAPVAASTQLRAIGVDSQGFTISIGTTQGDIGDQRGSGRDDVFLTKTDSLGNVVFSRLLGGSGRAEGFGLAIDANDNIIVVGQTTGKFSSNDVLEGQDTLVTKFSSRGEEIFTTQLDSLVSDGARAVTTDASGNIFVAGVVTGSLPGESAQGGQDIFVARLNGTTGALSDRVQLGTTGNDTPAALAIAQDGSVLLASTQNGRGVLRKFDGNALDTQLAQTDLGALGAGGQIKALQVDQSSGTIVVAGSTALDLDAGPALSARSGGVDGFVARLEDDFTKLGVTFLGSAQSDSLDALALVGDKIFVAGQTNGSVNGARSGTTDTLLARLDLTTGTIETTQQFGTAGNSSGALALAATTQSPGVLSKFGLRVGELRPTAATGITAQTSLREGDHFSIRVNGGPPRKVVIDANETFDSLAKKLNRLSNGIDAKSVESTRESRFQLQAKIGNVIELIPGKGEADALAKIGLEPSRLLDADRTFDVVKEKNPIPSSLRPGGAFALGLDTSFSIKDATSAAFVTSKLDAAVSTVQRAFRSLFFDDFKANLAQKEGTKGVVPASVTKQISNFQEALRRLGGGGGGGGSLI